MNSKRKVITADGRKIILRLRNEGKTLRAIGKMVGGTHFSIQRVINNCKLSKSVISNLRSGSPSKLTFREKKCILKSVRLNPRITASQIVNDIRERFIKLFMKTPYGKFWKRLTIMAV